MADRLPDRADDVIDRLFKLGDEDGVMANVDAFCLLLKNLHERDLSIVKEPHASAIAMVRAGILRGAIGAVMACLDSPGDNRASVGQILKMLKDTTLADFFATTGQGSRTALSLAQKSYEDLRENDSYNREKQLRHKAVAHALNTPSPGATYDDLYEVTEIAKQIVADLYEACGRGAPEFLKRHQRTADHAKLLVHLFFRHEHGGVRGKDTGCLIDGVERKHFPLPLAA